MQFLETLFLFLDPIVVPATVIFVFSISIFWLVLFITRGFLGSFSRKLERYLKNNDEEQSMQTFVMCVGLIGLAFTIYFLLLCLSWFYVFVWGLF